MSTTSTQQVMDRYLAAGHDSSVLAEDVVFTIMGTGAQHHGPEAVGQMLHDLYEVSFNATAELRHMMIGEHGAAGEFDFVGTHTGNFAGVPATGKQVRVPFAVIYEVENNQIKRARVYMEIGIMLVQLGVLPDE